MASGDGTNIPPTTSIVLPNIPHFVRDPTQPDNGSLWLQQVEIKFSLASNLTNTHKCALVSSVLDADAFARLARGLLPDKIAGYADWDKFKAKFIELFDIERSLFADRYSAFQIEWRGPAYESIHELVSRIRHNVDRFKLYV